MGSMRKPNSRGKLTPLLQHLPINMKKLKDYGRINKIDVDELYKLAVTYETLTKEKMLKGLSVFHVASSISKPDILEHLVNEGWDVNYSSDVISAPIHSCLNSGNIDGARKLIELGADCKAFQPGLRSTPMFTMLTSSKREKLCATAVKLLLKAGVSVDDPLTEGMKERAIHVAVVNNYPSIVSCLLQNGADVNIQDTNGFTPLHCAVKTQHLEIIKLLLLHGPDFYKQSLTKDTPLSLAVEDNYKAAIELFVQNGYDINKSFNVFIAMPLHKAVHLLNKDLVTFLIGLGANVNLAGGNNVTPLHVVADKYLLADQPLLSVKNFVQRRKEIVEVLVENGADVNFNSYVPSPLTLSIKCGSVALAKLFLKLGANPNIKHENTYLLFDVVDLEHDVIVTFLEHGADYTVWTKSGITPYHRAIEKRVDVRFIKSFVKHGCPYNLNKPIWEKFSKFTNYGTEMFFKAEIHYFKGLMENNINVVKEAVDRGAIVSSCSEEMKYPLHFLAIKGHKELLAYLMEKQYPPNLLNDKGETALHIAAKHGHYDICCTLLRFGASYNCTSKQCSSTPKALADAHNKRDIVKLFDRLSRIFYLASCRDHRVIKVLKNRLSSNVNEYLMFVKAVNHRGDTILATALRNNIMENAKLMMDLQLQHEHS